MDLVDEMNWEDSDKVEFLTLEDAGLEDFPVFDNVFTVQVNNYYLLEDTVNGD